MPSRPNWKGYLKLSLVSVPIISYSAVNESEGDFHFNQLHDKCHSRIKYVKTCPIHGPVTPDQIVSGYEFEKGHYVVVDKEELASVRSEEEKTIDVDSIVAENAVNPIYLTNSSSYLVPDGQVAQKPYGLIRQCLTEQKRVAIATRVVRGKDEVVLVRSTGKLLLLTVLSNSAQINETKPFEQDVEDVEVSAGEVKLARTLFDAFHKPKIDLSKYKDQYNERMGELIAAKVKGKPVVARPHTEQRNIINLIDALKQSVAAKGARSAKSGDSETSRIKRAVVNAKVKKSKRA